jgi:hypothetical protein
MRKTREDSSMGDGIAKRRRAVIVAIIAVVEQFGILWVFQAVDMTQRPDPYASDWISPGHLMLYKIIFANIVLAGALYVYSGRLLPDVWERVWWTGLAMAISPWTTFLLIALPFPGFVPWQVVLLAGIIAPYAFIGARLRRPR